METRHLRYFLAVMDKGSITTAAHELGIAQPALSQTLARMEKDLGVQLFVRSRRGASPTPAALSILDDVRISLARLDAAQQRAIQISQGHAGQLTIGLVSSALFGCLPKALRAMRETAPNVKLILREMSNEEQAEALRSGTIDLGLMHTPVAIGGGRMHERLIKEDRLLAAVPAEFQTEDNGTTTLQAVAEAGLVMFPDDQLPAFNADILDAIRKAGYSTQVCQHANRTLTILACVAGGAGVALLPTWIRSLNFEGVRFCDVSDGHVLPSFNLSAIWPARSQPTLADLFASLDF